MLKMVVFVFMACIEMVCCKLPSEQVNAITTVFKLINNHTIADISNATKNSKDPCLWKGVSCNPDHSYITNINFSSSGISRSDFLPFLCNITTLESLDVSYNHLGSIPDGFLNCCRNMTYLDFRKNKLHGPLPSFNGFNMLQHLYLSNNSFSGEVSTELDGLVSLVYLDLGYNSLEGRIPKNLGKLNLLVGLMLHGNYFSGSIPDELGQLTMLQTLWLSYNRLNGSIPPWICNVTTLRVFHAHSNSLTGSIPSGITSHLTSLNLRRNKLRGRIPSDLLSTPYLEHLDLSYNELQGPIPVGNASTLSELRLSYNNIEGTIPWDSFRSLESLWLHNNRLTGTLPWSISEMKNIRSLRLEGNNLRGSIPDSIGNLSSLRVLLLENNQLTGRIPVSLLQIQSLTILSLQGNMLSGCIPEPLGKSPSLRRLCLGNNQLSGTIPKSLSNLLMLEVLNLQGNNLHGPVPDSIRNLSSLEELKLEYNQLTGTIPDMPESLEYLDLSFNHFGGNIPVSLSRLAKLTVLDLQGNNLHGPIPVSIRNLSSLSKLQLGNNHLSGTIPHMPESLKIELNLSNNLFLGPIPHGLSNLWQLEVLDLSYNRFSGEIPDFLTRLSGLTHLLLMNNNLSGIVPRFRNDVEVDLWGNKYLIVHKDSPSLALSYKKKKTIHSDFLFAAASGVPVGLLISIIGLFVSRRYDNINGYLSTPNTLHRPAINFKKAMEAVSNPSNITLKAKFSTFYKAVMPSGTTYLVKKINHSKKMFQYPRYKELVEELEVLGELSNSNIMIPVAYILTVRRAYLFYEFVRGSLFDILHNRKGCRLDWTSRFKIAVGISKGLAFLHECSSGPIILLDLCSKSILLKSIDEPQISDIELCCLIHPPNAAFVGSSGYAPPEYTSTKRVTAAGNVYSFGVVLLELVIGKPAASGEIELAKWVLSLSEQGNKMDEILDSSVSGTSVHVTNQMLAVVEVALACINISPEMRPNSVSVLQKLQSMQ